MDAPMHVVAEFVEVTAAVSLNLVSDLNALLTEAGESTADMAFDEGNGIPDAAEMMVLEAVLENVGYNRVPNGGTGYRVVYAAWAANRTQAAADLPGEPAAVQRAIAAYMTLGESGHVAFAVSASLEVASVTLDPADYSDAPGLGALDDADGDSKWNRLEWKAVLEEYQVTTPTSADAAVYVNWVLNPELPADEDVDIGMDLPDGADPNWDYSYLPQGTVTFQSVDDVPIEVRILDPPGREDIPVVIGQPVSIPLGAELLITLAEGANPDWFHTWDAPGEMIDGSGEPSERFRLMRGGTIQPERRPITTSLSFVAPQTEFEWTYSWSGVGPFGHMIPAGSGTGQFDVPRGAYVRIRAHKSKAPAGGAKSSGAGNDVTYADIWSVDDPEHSGPFIVFGQASAYGGPYFGSITATGTDAALHGWLSHSAGCEQGGSGLIGATTSTNGSFFPFNYEVAKVPAPDPTDASHRILVVEAEMDPGYQAIGTTGFLGYYSGVLGAQSVLIETLKMLTLTLEVKVEGGGATPAEAGHVTAYEEDKAKKWYSATGVEYVQLDGSAHIGFEFNHWSGDGVAYPDGLLGGPALGTELPLDNPNAPVTENPIWIAMGEDTGSAAKGTGSGKGGKSREIQAVIVEAPCKLGIFVDDPTPNSSDPHPDLNANPGHSFWILLGDTADPALSPVANVAMGFYPDGPSYIKEYGVITWLTPPGIMGLDTNHPYTHYHEYEIDRSGFLTALEYSRQLWLSPPNYNAESSNCTDVLIMVAAVAGVPISAHGHCDHFDGNCPGALGEALND